MADQETEALALRINDETVDVHGIGVDVCKYIPLRHILPTKMHRLCEAITDDIFHSAGVQKQESPDCFKVISGQINGTQLLGSSKLEHYKRMDWARQTLSKVMRLQARTEKIVSAPAHVMGCVIAAIAYRKLQPSSERFFQENEDIVKFFGELNGIQWLPVAIKVWPKIRGCTFIIELDQSREEPFPELRDVEGEMRWVVTTRMPNMNRYERILPNALRPALQPPGPTVPKPEPEDNALPSVEPNDISNEPITVSDDEESEDNTITLRDYTRQMKILGKRLTTPDRAIARRARKEIMKKSDEVGEQEVEEIGPPKEYFDSYTYLKDVWKTCLQNGISIPNSLRVLVDHHCTPSQVFHLMELEKEHLAEMDMEIDGW
ncbi:hypothetical protein FCIRC_7240 [Fusarium circinatum]|uniref:Uncharacterized protein n=1 Tax=Fusarium circinatum TaxID=48490 RepID=A0A8H5TUT2_FUSCI|nr:hypothetical protein FCIRC_7240 [Fusarium circinatum]